MPRAPFDFARYMNIRSAYAPELTPDGRELLFLANITGVPQLWAQSLTGGWPRQLTYFDERISGAAVAPDGAVRFAMDAGGDEHDGLYLLSPDRTTVTPLTHNPRAIHIAGAWAPSGRRLAYAVNDRDPRFFDLYLLDLSAGDTAEPRLILSSDHTNRAGSWSPDGRQMIVRRIHTPSNVDLLLLDLETSETTHLTPHEGDARYVDAGFAADGAAIFITTDQDRDYEAPARLTIATRQIEILDDKPWDAADLTVSPDRTRLAYTHNVEGYSTLRVLDLPTATQLEPPALPPGVIMGGMAPGTGRLGWTPDGRALAFTYHSATRSMNIWLFRPDIGELRQITFAPDGGIPADCHAAPQTIHYPTFDGRQIPALYFKPGRAEGIGQGGHGGPPLPVIVIVHGGPEGQSRPIFNPTVQYFVNRGYAVLLPNVRGSTGYGKAYSHLDDVRNRMDSVKDLAACVDWLAAHGGADRRRIAVMGGSYGGFMTLAAVANYPDLWAAGVDIVGIANFRTFLENTGPFRRRLREAEYGNLDDDADFLDQISPIHKAGEIRAPMIILHGANDPRVPISESEQIAAILREREVPVEYYRYPDEGHGLVKLANKVHGYTAIGDFLDRYMMDNA